jgi:CubicO group peptidase (beta-lactamase class C family)
MAGAGLAEAIRTHVTGPLGLHSTGFRPLDVRPGRPPGGIAPTEIVADRGLVCGVVHDDNAWAMGGISAHAGLFSTAGDMGRLGAVFLEASRGRHEFLPQELAARAMAPTGGGVHTLVWDTKSPAGSSAGTRFGSASLGHLGFTGCSIWLDPEAMVVAVLLTNRIHPTRGNEAIHAFRPRFHDAVIQDVLS